MVRRMVGMFVRFAIAGMIAVELGCRSEDVPVDATAQVERDAPEEPQTPSVAPSRDATPRAAVSSPPPAPTREDVTASFGAWMRAPASATVPREIGEASIDVRIRYARVGTRFKPKPPQTWRVRGSAELRLRVDELVRASGKEELLVPGGTISCDATCCAYGDDDTWGGIGYVWLESVCFETDADGVRVSAVHLSRGDL
jgi:hypothetical protein